MMLFVSFSATAQSNDDLAKKKFIEKIDELRIFPNPVTEGKLFIRTKLNLTKRIEIYDILGKMIFTQTLYGNELNINDLNSGVYILKIKEGKFFVTRKLVVY